MKLNFLLATIIWLSVSLAPTVSSAQSAQPQQPSPSPTSGADTQPNKPLWSVTVVSVEKIKPGTENEPHMNPGEMILKVGIKFEYLGPPGDIPAPVAKVTEAGGKEHIMLGNLQASEGFECLAWIISASHAVFKEKPQSLASTTIARCKAATFSYYFLMSEGAQEPFMLNFGDAKPLRLTLN